MRRVLLLAVLVAGCVNDYLVRGSDTSSSGSDDGTSGDATTTSGGGDATTGGPGDATSGGMGDTTTIAGMGDGTAGGFTCEPCTADAQCGDDWDLCVALDEAGPNCLFACPEGGCPDGLNCRSVLSVDGVAAMQCAPSSAACVPEVETGGSGDGTTGSGDGSTGAGD